MSHVGESNMLALSLGSDRSSLVGVRWAGTLSRYICPDTGELSGEVDLVCWLLSCSDGHGWGRCRVLSFLLACLLNRCIDISCLGLGVSEQFVDPFSLE